ncbi:MAG: hypothetical protein WBE26_14580, partial [Phycisphaerae bacterium]
MDWLARSPQRSFIVVFLLAFAIRGFLLTQVPPWWVHPDNLNNQERILAMGLIERGEFGDIYILPTGPTAHVPPIV